MKAKDEDKTLPLIEDSYVVSTPDKNWYVAYISPNGRTPNRVAEYAQRKGFKAYWPKRVTLEKRGTSRRRKTVLVVRPLLQRYALVHLPSHDTPFGALTDDEGKFNGICDFVKNSRGPLYLADPIVESLVHREREGEFNDTYKKGRKVVSKLPPWVFVGNIVKVNEGPFASFPGLIEDIDVDRERLKLLLSIFGRSTPIDLELAQVSEL